MIVDEHPEWPGTEPRTDLRYIGYWRPNKDMKHMRGYPNPREYVDWDWDADERRRVIEYLENVRGVLYSWHGSSTCRICGIRPCGNHCFTDGTYAWPEGFVHYLRVHGVKPPEEFINHCLGR